jgi:outer membrane protein
VRKILFFIILTLFIIQSGHAQKFGYVDTEYILSKMPEYKKAQDELDQISEKYQKEVHDMLDEVEKNRKAYQVEEVLLTDELKKEKQDTIAAREKRARAYQKKIFGFEGLIFLKKQELVKPVQDKVFEAIEKVAKTKQLQIVFDKSGDLVILYSDLRHDYSDYVLEELGLGDPKDTVDNKK